MKRPPQSDWRPIRRERVTNAKREQLPEETRHAILAVVLFVLAGVSLLSFFELAGPLGKHIDSLEGVLLGWLRYALPFALIAIGALLLSPRRSSVQGTSIIGWLLMLIGLAGLFHLFYPLNDSLSKATDGQGGGYIGYGIAWPMAKITGRAASSIILFALLLIGILVTFKTTLQRLVDRSTSMGFFMRFVRRLFSGWRQQQDYLSNVENDEVSLHDTTPAFSKKAIPGNDTPHSAITMPSREVALENFSLPKARKGPKVKTNLPLSLLADASTSPTSGDVKANSMVIKKALENFGIHVEMGEVNIGPTVTQYTLKPADGVKLAQILTLQKDLALALAAHPIRIEAPIPGKSLVGVEVPNKGTAIVSLKEILDSDEFRHRKSNLTIALGKDVAGKPVVTRLDAMPHLLIAGATGSGKSVCINSILISLLYENSPDELKFIMVDPKRVELTIYNDIPHLITPVVTDVKKTVNALKWAVAEMDRRYRVLSDVGVRNLAGYNALAGVDPLPYIVVVIDELADLMAATANEVEGAIVRLAQMARAVGIHLIVATQRPSVDVITGLIKANITSRIAFSVASLIDSRTIIDGSGAEKLLGKGDMLYVSAELAQPRRLQGALVSEPEIQRVVDQLREQANPEYEETVVETPAFNDADGSGSSEDDLYDDAKAIVVQAGKASASLLQRRLRIGYARAARLLDIMEELGVIGPLDGARPREILVQGNGEPEIEQTDEIHPVVTEEDKEPEA